MAKSVDHKACIQLIASTVVPAMGATMYPKGESKLQGSPPNEASMGKNKKKPVKFSSLKFFRDKSSEDSADDDIRS